MTQIMEAWFLADPDRLGECYRKGFHANALPNNRNVEQIDKQTVMRSLDDATRRTKKGKYQDHKTQQRRRFSKQFVPKWSAPRRPSASGCSMY